MKPKDPKPLTSASTSKAERLAKNAALKYEKSKATKTTVKEKEQKAAKKIAAVRVASSPELEPATDAETSHPATPVKFSFGGSPTRAAVNAKKALQEKSMTAADFRLMRWRRPLWPCIAS